MYRGFRQATKNQTSYVSCWWCYYHISSGLQSSPTTEWPMRIVVHSIQCLLIVYRIKQTKVFSVLVCCDKLWSCTGHPFRTSPSLSSCCNQSVQPKQPAFLHPLVAPKRRYQQSRNKNPQCVYFCRPLLFCAKTFTWLRKFLLFVPRRPIITTVKSCGLVMRLCSIERGS